MGGGLPGASPTVATDLASAVAVVPSLDVDVAVSPAASGGGGVEEGDVAAGGISPPTGRFECGSSGTTSTCCGIAVDGPDPALTPTGCLRSAPSRPAFPFFGARAPSRNASLWNPRGSG